MSTVEIPLISRNEEVSKSKPEKNETSILKSFIERIKGLEGWRFTVASGVLAGILILLATIITLAVVFGKNELFENSVTFFTGSCAQAKATSVGAHVVINILSTILLAYSNFTMQCLSSPTRKEVDLAHSRQHWLNIGTPSIRNLFFVSKKKAALWLVLGASSFPLHMFWNSTVFQTKASYNYIAATVMEDFMHGGNWTLPRLTSDSSDLKENPNVDFDGLLSTLQEQALNQSLVRLSVEDCIEKYDTEVLSDRRHVLLVAKDSDKDENSHSTPSNETVLAVYYNVNPLGDQNLKKLSTWMCDEGSSRYEDDCGINDKSHWVPGRSGGNAGTFGTLRPSIMHCYSHPETGPGKCKVDLIPTFIYIVMVCNLIKILSFIGALYLMPNDHPLCTTGDAIQSFLKSPDPYTRGRCLAAKEDYERLIGSSKEWKPRPPEVGDTWTGGRYYWGKAVNKPEIILYFMIATGLLVATPLLLYDSRNGSGSMGSSGEDFGDPQSQNEFYGGSSRDVLKGFLIANIPQVAISYVYMRLNSIITTMLAMAEWCAYATESGSPHKGLRVSSPQPNTAQRSTYFLSLPYKWAIPCTVTVTILHWLVSQMLFFARVDIYRLSTEPPEQSLTISQVYWSSLAMKIVEFLGSAILAFIALIVIIGRYPDRVPLAGGCSASIAASCHPSRLYEDDMPNVEFDPDISLKKLVWGVVESPIEAANGNVGHATFSSTEVHPLAKDELYA